MDRVRWYSLSEIYRMNDRLERLPALLGGLILAGAFIMALHWAGNHLPGHTGNLLRRNMNSEIKVGAYFYADVGEIEEFIDDDRGKYGARELGRFLTEPHAPRETDYLRLPSLKPPVKKTLEKK